MPPEKELTFLASFPCPHCKAALESPSDRPGVWVRCPKCKRASRAPEALVRRQPPPIQPGEDVLRIEPAPEPKPMTPVAVATLPERVQALPQVTYEPTSVWRVVCGAVMLLAVIGLLFSFLEKSEIGIIGCGIVTALSLVILIRGGLR